MDTSFTICVGQERRVLAQPAAADGRLLLGQRDLLQDFGPQSRRLQRRGRALRPLHYLVNRTDCKIKPCLYVFLVRKYIEAAMWLLP